jgi:DNA-binding response OmpR family regulator
MTALAEHPHVVLVVDDDGAIRELVADVLCADRCRVREAASVSEALSVIAQSDARDCIILLDVMLAEVSGPVGMPRLRAVTSAPIIAMSASADHLILARAAGAAADLRKPFDLGTLCRLLHEHCSYVGQQTGRGERAD